MGKVSTDGGMSLRLPFRVKDNHEQTLRVFNIFNF
jgi:hypothetical protein